MSMRRPARTMAWSSTSKTVMRSVIAAVGAADERKVDHDRGAGAGKGFHPSRAAEKRGALAHAVQTQPAGVFVGGGHASAVVFDQQTHPIAPALQNDTR